MTVMQLISTVIQCDQVLLCDLPHIVREARAFGASFREAHSQEPIEVG